MASCAASQALVSAQTCSLTSPKLFNSYPQNVAVSRRYKNRSFASFTVRASASSDDPECNDEECAPEKEVGKVSMGWVAEERTKVTGTFPPRTRGWTGYVEKDTAGQTNIYSVEPAVYIAESAISSGTAGSSSDGAENTAAIAAGLALIAVAAASSILLQVGKNAPQVQTVEYSGPSLSYYISKFKPPEVIQASVPSQTESSSSVQPESSPAEAPEIQAQSEPSPEIQAQSEPSPSSVSEAI